MTKQTLIKFIFLLASIAPVQATTLPDFPTAWKIGQKVHVKFTNFSNGDKMAAINYIKSKIDPLHLDIKLVFDDNLIRPDGLTEGIEIRNTVGTSTVCAKTSTVSGFDEVNFEWAVKKIIRIDTTCYGTTFAYGAPWYNVILHEFNHALFMDHIENRDHTIPPVLMFSDVYLDRDLLWSFADQWQLKRKYNRNQWVNYKRMNFRRKDIGKYCFLVRGNRSVGFRIQQQSELLPYLGRLDKYRRVII